MMIRSWWLRGPKDREQESEVGGSEAGERKGKSRWYALVLWVAATFTLLRHVNATLAFLGDPFCSRDL